MSPPNKRLQADKREHSALRASLSRLQLSLETFDGRARKVTMAFDGPGPFDGDPVYNWQDEVELMPASYVRAMMQRAFERAVSSEYLDVDDGVWAWATAEMLALALGHASKPPPPPPFDKAVNIEEPKELIDQALAALNAIEEVDRSELAALYEEGQRNLSSSLGETRSRLSLALDEL